jgi:hypothetical protein
MLTVFTEGGEKAKEENDQIKEKGNHNMATDTIIETEPLSATNPIKEREKGKADKKARDAAQAEVGIDPPLRPVRSYCSIPGHNARDCRRRQNDEKEKQEKTPNKQGKEARNHVQIVDELDLQFAQHVSCAELTPPTGKPMRTSTRTGESENGTRLTGSNVEEVINQAPHATKGDESSVNTYSRSR